ncbi:hypothetical protein V7157_21535 [Neobacillus drentensis]|uniref:hypothetical protein n=1 Tax=Neobacillus drentensis TaxID=220684 RepID=UPI0030027C4D
MQAPFILGLGITFFLLVPLGMYTNIFPFCAIGLTSAGLSFILISLKWITKSNKNRKKLGSSL